ncbi:MAG TPA: hypothetical protein VEG39_07275 [Clostridia bacterium]|nr:hypothetical protein [Clostridia bacterium]
MKRLGSLLLVLVLIVSLFSAAGCTRQESAPASTAPAAAEANEASLIGVAMPTKSL